MRHIAGWVSNLNIRKKIIFYTYSILVPILLLICVGLWVYDYHKQQVKSRESYMTDVRGLSDSLNIVLSDVYNLSTYIMINQDIRDILTADNTEELNRDSRIWAHEAPMQMVEDMMALKGYIKTAALYPENGVMPYLRCIDSTSAYISTLDEIRNTPAYREALESRGRSGWKYAGKGEGQFYQANRSGKIVLYREIYNLSKKTPLGYLALGMSEEALEKICRNILKGAGDGVLIFNHDGDVLYSCGSVSQDLQGSLVIAHTGQKEEQRSVVKGYDAFFHTDPTYGMTVCKTVPVMHFRSLFMEVGYMPLALLLGILAGLFPVLLIVSNLVSKPLGRVCEAMMNFRRGDFEQSLLVNTHDEVGEVADCFNVMVHDIRELINRNYVYALKEKESELATLQAQINPHFLYNTLDSLYWQASDAGQEEIAENIYALSQLFRMVLGQGNGIVTVEQEVELVSRYLEIQRMRFNKRVDYRVEVETALLQEKIPKLILQPFVENAVVHGAESEKETCMITVTGKKRDGRMEFVIRDTGVGMTAEQVEAIWAKPGEQKGGSYKIGRYAIYNVKERLELKYGQDFALSIESVKGEGTAVRLRIPFQAEGREGI